MRSEQHPQVAKMCDSLAYEHDECKATLQDQLSHNEKLLLRLRELEESLQCKEKDLSFSQSAVRTVQRKWLYCCTPTAAMQLSTHRQRNR